LTLPFTDPVLIVATATLIFLVVPLLAERVRVPGVVGLILVGAAVGPNGLGLLGRDDTIVLLGTVGLLYLMLMVGLELDLHEFARFRNQSIVFGTLSFVIPGVLGAAMALAMGYRPASALLVASAFSSHTLLAFPIASRLGIVRNAAVTTALGGTILTEILALLLLAVVVNGRGGTLDAAFWAGLAVPFALYVGVVLWALPRLGRWFFRNLAREGSAEFIFVLASLFVVSYAAHYGGVEPIVGALLAGLALNRLIPEHGALMNRIHFVGNTIFIPFFLLSVGMLVNVRALNSVDAMGFAAALAIGVTLAKWLAARVAQRVLGYTADEGWVVFGLSVPHAAGTLAIVLIGFEVGLLDQAEVNGVVLMILVTCMVGPWAVERYGRRVALAEARRPHDASSAPQRILIPLANPSTAERLVELALVLRGRESGEPLLALAVVPGEGESQVAEAEGMLRAAVGHGAAAGVTVLPVTRVDPNVAAGIARGVAETRSNLMVIGWDGRRTGERVVFGSVLDALLERTRALVIVVRPGRPLGTAGRILLVVPPAAERHPGFAEAVRAVNLLASGAGAALAGIAVAGDPEGVREAHAAVRPRVAATWEPVAGWGELPDHLRAALAPNDVVVLLGARRGTLAWTPRLQRVPGMLAELAPEGLAVVYPPEPEAEEVPPIAEAVAPDRVVRLGGGSFVAAVGRMLEGVVDEDSAREAANVVVRNEQQFSSEIVPGVVLPHVRLKGLPRPILVLGVSDGGIRFPLAKEPARLIFLLVSPAERAEEHLRALADIARLLSTPGRVGELLERFAPGTPLDWLHVDD
jgi:Kef-type K+ transport system membrane component KefB/mannitol/fructose-specific phosphotransferase system IIA component (Ntr-type)/nucleotide-binding universal stress UspA family protein